MGQEIQGVPGVVASQESRSTSARDDGQSLDHMGGVAIREARLAHRLPDRFRKEGLREVVGDWLETGVPGVLDEGPIFRLAGDEGS